jgi:IS5 family transposase
MLRLTTEQRDFWDYLLPEEARRMSPELEKVDAILDDESFLAPFRERFPAKRGRYTIPMETYLRLMYLKVRYGLGYESLMAEVNDSVSWRRFCRISLSGRVPDASTLIKLTNGPCRGLAEEVHTALVQQLTRKKVLRGRKVRVDTTVVEADIHYPTDAQLLADGVRVVTRAVGRLQKVALAGATAFRDVGRSIKRRLQRLGKGLKQPEGQKQATRATVTAEVLTIAEGVVRRAQAVRQRVVQEIQQQPAPLREKAERELSRLDTWLERTQRVMEQTREVLRGNVHLPNRLVSLFDPEARPIRKGKLKVAGGTEFGYKVVVAEEERGFITHYQVASGNPEDSTLLVPAVEGQQQQVGRVPRAVATDRGMASAANERKLTELGVKRCSLPKTGKKSPEERAKEAAPWFRRLQRFRAGGEARISLLKRKYGWRRSLLRGSEGVKTWAGWGIITHNLTRYARLSTPAAA